MGRSIILVAAAAAALAIILMGYKVEGQIIADNHVALFVFGDSLYDVGMNAYYKRGTLSTLPPYGESYFKTPTGRYSDGRLVPDYITQFANLPFLQPYLKPGLTNFTNGINFAAAGATVLVDIRPGTINLKMQIDYFVQMVGKLNAQIGAAQTNKLLKQAVYLFSIGGNDYATLVSTTINNQAVLTPTSKAQYINRVLANYTTQIQRIYNSGGRKFAFQNVGPIGCLPSTKQLYADVGQESNSCAKLPQTLAKTHNSLFLGIAQKLQTQLSGFKYTIFDSYAQTFYRVQYHDTYGFKVSNSACCGSGKFNGAFTCGSTTTKYSLCSDPTDYLFFDAAHPTDKANGQLAQLFWSGPSTVVSPYTMKALFDMH